MARPRIAVVGAGLFGVTTALVLDRLGCDVTLLERGSGLLKGATAGNMNRLHLGYHYPRCLATAASCRDSEPAFRAEYGEAVIDDFRHLYAIAQEGSFTSGSDFLATCRKLKLPYRETEHSLLESCSIETVVEVDEALIDIPRLRGVCQRKLDRSRVTVRLRTPVSGTITDAFDFVVLATYAHRPEGYVRKGIEQAKALQYELCEVMVTQLPQEHRDLSMVVMDGPFFCIDPQGRTGLTLLYHVKHSVQLRDIGRQLRLPLWVRPLLDAGCVYVPEHSRFSRAVDDAATFAPELKQAKYLGSIFTVRVVPAGLDRSDSRPTIVRRLSPSVIEVFSGKLGTCTMAADAVAAEILP